MGLTRGVYLWSVLCGFRILVAWSRSLNISDYIFNVRFHRSRAVIVATTSVRGCRVLSLRRCEIAEGRTPSDSAALRLVRGGA